MRRCYVTRMRFWKDEDTEYRVRWYRANPDAKVVTGPTQFRSFSTWERGLPAHPLGEQLAAPDTTYDRGRNAGNFRGDHYEGSPEAWQRGGIRGIDEEIETDAFGGTEHCPYRTAPGPVAVASTPKGRGYVVAVGGPSLFTVPGENGSPSIGWNERFWAAVHEFADEHGRDGAIASPGDIASWRIPQLWPEYSGVGGVDIDYSSDGARNELDQKLASVSVLVCGYTGADFASDRQLFNVDILPQILSWVNSGGVLVVVNNTLPFDGSPEPLVCNGILEAVNVDLRFAHGDEGYGVHFDWNQRCNSVSVGVEVAPHEWGDRTNLKLPFPAAANVLPPSNPAFTQWIVCGVRSQTITSEAPTKVIWRWWMKADAPPNAVVLQFIANGTESAPFLSFVVPLFLTWTQYEYRWGYPFSLGDPDGKAESISIRLGGSLAPPSRVYISGLEVEEDYCVGGPCGERGLLVNGGHPIINQPAAEGLCGVRAQQFSTITGGDWVVCQYLGNGISPCAHGGVRVGGAAQIAFTPGVPVAGGLAVGGTGTLVLSPGVPPAGGLAVGGSATFAYGTPGGGFIVGDGGLAVGGSATFAYGTPAAGFIVGDGGLAVGGSALVSGP